jgi:hypothetical protein
MSEATWVGDGLNVTLMSKGRRNSNERGNASNRRARKLWLLNEFGDGVKAPCWECGTLVDFDTMIVDRITPGEQGGTYRRNNIRVHCVGCSGRQGQRRTMEIRNVRD